MSALPSFVDRSEELRTVFNGIEGDDDEGTFYSIIGPGGHGKTLFLQEIEDQYSDDENVFVLKFGFNSGLTSVKQFGAEFQERWKEEVPSGKTEKAKRALYRVVRSKYSDITIDALASTGSFVIPQLSALSVGKHLLPDGEEGSNVPLYAEILTDFLSEFSRLNPDCTLLVLLDHYDRVETRQEEFDRLFKSLSREIPENVVFCIASRHRRLTLQHDVPITPVELGEFNEEETKTYLTEAGLEASGEEVAKVVEATGGNPYYLNRFASIAVESDVESALQDLPESQIQGYLESEFLNNLTEDQERLLRNICALPEFRRDIVSELIGEDSTKTRRELQALYRESVLEKIGHHESYPVYKPHDLLHSYLRESTPNQRLAEQHRECATIYANDVKESPLLEVLEDFIWDSVMGGDPGSGALEEFAQTTGDRFATGIMVDLHLEGVPTSESKEDQLVNLLRDPAVNEGRATAALSLFYSGQDDVDWGEVSDRINDEEEEKPPAENVLRTDTDQPPEQLLVSEVSRAIILISERENYEGTKMEREFKQISETLRKLTENEEIYLVAGACYVLLQLCRVGYHSERDEVDEKEAAKEDAKRFLKTFYGFTEDDYIFCKHFAEGLGNHLENPDLDISMDAEKNLESAVDTKGVYGGAKSGLRETILQLISELYEARENSEPLIQDRKTLKNASREAAIHFADNGHHATAAVIRDIGTMLEFVLGGKSVSSRDEIDLAFRDTKLAQQLDYLISAVEWGDNS